LDGTGTFVWVKKPPMVTLYIDNRAHGSVAMACGQLAWTVKANAQEMRTILAPPKGGECPLTIDRRAVGELDGAHYLVDVSATRTYRFRTVVYTAGGVLQFGLDAPALPPPTTSGRQPLHKLPGQVDFFLTPFPKTITVTVVRFKNGPNFPGSETRTRTELLQID
jgi:hypothetical protein